MPSYKLTYFKARARGELIRLLLTAAGQKFEDVTITFEEWPKLKPSMPLKVLPVLEVDGKQLSQSLAISRYLAREFKLNGGSNWEMALVEQIVDSVNDLADSFYKYYFESDEAKKAELKKKLLEETFPNTMKIFAKLMKENGSGGYFVGKSLTMADLFVYDNGTTFLALDSKPLDKFPTILANRKLVESSPNLKEYLAKRPKSDI